MADILLIDDDESFRGMLCRLLTRAGHTVVSCGDGRRGVELFRLNPQSLVITDLIMPDQEGIETIIQLRREFPGVKIIAMSGGGRVTPDIYLNLAASLGALKTFSKPFDTGEFLAAIRALTGQDDPPSHILPQEERGMTLNPNILAKMQMKEIAIIWTPTLQVGIEEIDNQHRRLYSLLANFYTNLQKGAGREVLAKMLEDLMSHAGEHFVAEEAYLKGHPDLGRHRQQHYSFIKQMNQFERDYLHGNISLAVDMVNYVYGWLQEHIPQTDQVQILSLQKTASP